MAEQVAAPTMPKERWWLVALLLLAALLVRLAWVLYFPNQLYADSEWYYEQAINLAQNRGYLFRGQPSAIWPVGYPFFLSLVFRVVPPSEGAAKLANVLLLTVDLGLIYGYARLSSARAFTPLATTLLIAFMPTHIMASSLVAAEALFACFFHFQLILLLLASRRRQPALWLLAGAMSGVIAYIRPEAGIFLLVTLILYGNTVWQQATSARLSWRPFTLALLIGLSAVLVILPWTIRNVVKLGMLIPISTTGCMNLWIGNFAGADGGYVWPRDPALNPTMLREHDTEQSWYRRSCAAAMDAIRQDPVRVFRLWPQKLVKLWKNDDGMVYWNFARTARQLPQQQVDLAYRLADVYYHILLAGGLFGLLSYPVRRILPTSDPALTAEPRSDAYWVTLLALFAFTLVYLPFFGSARFHFVLTPLLAWMAMETVLYLWILLMGYRRSDRKLP